MHVEWHFVGKHTACSRCFSAARDLVKKLVEREGVVCPKHLEILFSFQCTIS